MTDKPNALVGIDMGGMRTRCVVVAVDGPAVRYVSCGSAASSPWWSPDPAGPQLTTEAVTEAVCAAEQGGGLTIISAVVGVGVTRVRSDYVQAASDLPADRQEVRASDVRRAIRKCERWNPGPGWAILQLVPQVFTAGTYQGPQYPVGMPASRIEALVLAISADRASQERALKSVQTASVQVEETLLDGFAAAYATLDPAEQAQGVAHLNIGKAGSSLIAFCNEGQLVMARSIPLGSDRLVADVARAFDTTPAIAASLIADFGSVHPHGRSASACLRVPSADTARRDELGRAWPRRLLGKIIALRIEECLELAGNELRQEGLLGGRVRSLVLTGDLASLPGMSSKAQSVACLRSRVGAPTGPADLPEKLRSPAWASAVGAALYAHRLGYSARTDRRAQVASRAVAGRHEVNA